jgi:drug/metabolite transporter (DMT)-like permease
VVATRFLGVLVAAAIALALGPAEARSAATSVANWQALVPAAFMLMAVPIYLNQIGVKRASPLTVRVLLALGPVFLIALQTGVGGTKLSGYSLAGVCAYCVIAIVAALARMIRAWPGKVGTGFPPARSLGTASACALKLRRAKAGPKRTCANARI